MSKCVICRRSREGWLCARCHRAFLRHQAKDTSMSGLMEWTAKRAHRFAKAAKPEGGAK
jgi:hypothetical protein